ncbi:MAG: PKD domain-containing protein [Anaerolineae bacterium]|nr:PKD domain-containing protein [Anaerolineae bacterium]
MWDFGDGVTSTETNPGHLYTAEGDYTVTLTAQNAVGSDVATAVVSVLAAPQASFTATSPTELGSATIFTNTSTGGDLSFWWDFGDTITSTETSPSHTYATTGTFTVTLTVSNAVGVDVATAVVIVMPPVITPGYTLFLPIIVAAPPE